MKPLPLEHKRALITITDKSFWYQYIVYEKLLWIKAMQMLNPGWLNGNK